MSVTFKGKALIPSKYLEAADLQGKKVPVIIEAIRFADMPARVKGGQAERRPLFILRDKEKGWILNRTNLNAIAAIYGNKADAWIGKTVVIYSTKVDAFGSMKDAVRVDVEATEARAANGAADSKQDEPPHDPETGEVSPADAMPDWDQAEPQQ